MNRADERVLPLRRRGLLGVAASGAGWAAGAAARAATSPQPAEEMVDLARSYPFYGAGEQAGIRTPPQRHVFFMSFDLTTARREDLRMLLALWSGAIAQMVQGRTIGQVEPAGPNGVGMDTGEALEIGPAALTVTVGLGPRVFGDEFGLAAQKPARLRPLVQLPSDAFDPSLTGGDLSLQACADDPQVAYHAVRDLARLARSTGAASTRWAVLGFGRASAGPAQTTPRNLLGFKDGTRNIQSDEDYERFVWVADGPAWQRRGTYQVVRKISMNLENWDTNRVGNQNRVFGRHKLSGAPLSGTREFDTPDFTRLGADGKPMIPLNAHIALAAHENNGGLKILRRSYNYTDGIGPYGQLSAGLLFISYQNDPAHFEALQTKLGAADALNEYISHIGSAVFFVPPAPAEGHHIAQEMFT